MIDGLKLTMSGEEIRRRLDERIRGHERCAEHWKREQARTPEDETEEHPLLPDHICENEAERQAWQAGLLAFIRDHLEPEEIYRLGEADLEFGELLPQKPGWMEQEEYERETEVGFNLGRIAKAVRGFSAPVCAMTEGVGIEGRTDERSASDRAAPLTR